MLDFFMAAYSEDCRPDASKDGWEKNCIIKLKAFSGFDVFH